MEIPFYNYSARFAPDRKVIVDMVAEVGASDKFILKDRVAEFEGIIADYTGAKCAIAVSSGTSALTVALTALGVGRGADVLTPAFSFVASASTVANLGARPVFVDVDPRTCTMLPEEVVAKITPWTRAIVPVHLFSVLADVTRISRTAEIQGIPTLEDSAVSLGARRGGSFAGLLGDVGVFSFFPAKPLGNIGDGGMIVTNDAEIGKRCRMLRNHGQDGITRFQHQLLGYNHRMDELSAAFLIHRFESFPELIRRRAEIARHYDERLGPLYPDLEIPPRVDYQRVYYTYVIQTEDRNELRAYLAERGIETQIYYPLPLHLQQGFAYLGHERGDFPNAERLATRTLALPLYPEMPDNHFETVADAVVEFHAGR